MNIGILVSAVLGKLIGEKYFIDATGGSDSDDGRSPGTAWQTIAKVNSESFNAGDRILFKRGETWSGTKLTINDSGEAGNNIVLSDYGSGAAPIIENTGVWPSFTNVLLISGNYITAENLLIQDCHEIGLKVTGNYVTVDNCEITDVGYGIGLYGTNGTVINCNIHDLHMVRDDASPDDDFGAVGVDVFASNQEIAYNTFTNCRATSTDYGFDGGAVEIWATANVSDIDIHHNWAEGCNGFMESSGTGSPTISDVSIYLNISHNNRSFMYTHLSAISFDNVRVYANTIIEESLADQEVYLIAFDANPGASDYLFYNNLIYLRANNFDRIWWVPANLTHENNLYDHDAANFSVPALTPDASEIIDTSGLVNIGADNFRPDTGSNAIDEGQDDGLTSDYEYNNKPQGVAADIGAYEYIA